MTSIRLHNRDRSNATNKFGETKELLPSMRSAPVQFEKGRIHVQQPRPKGSCSITIPRYDLHYIPDLDITVAIDKQYPVLINRALARRSRL